MKSNVSPAFEYMFVDFCVRLSRAFYPPFGATIKKKHKNTMIGNVCLYLTFQIKKDDLLRHPVWSNISQRWLYVALHTYKVCNYVMQHI